MITAGRLKELIKGNARVYDFIDEQYVPLNPTCFVDEKVGVLYWFKENFKDDDWVYPLEDLFETKKDAEFVLKNYTSKTLYFRPPTFLEFIKTRREGIYAHWDCGDISIVMEEDNQQKGVLRSENVFRVDDENNYESFRYEYDEWLDNREEIYYKAVEYAKKLFLED